jgi:serine/threonine protein kinase
MYCHSYDRPLDETQVHLDVKPGNILIEAGPLLPDDDETSSYSAAVDDQQTEKSRSKASAMPVFKLADFGQCVRVEPRRRIDDGEEKMREGADDGFSIEEGDRRYLSQELMQGRVRKTIASLGPCDMFALGASLYEVCFRS